MIWWPPLHDVGPVLEKVVTFYRIWARLVLVRYLLLMRPLPEVVDRLGSARVKVEARRSPVRLGEVVVRSLTVAGYRPRCLISSLVLFRLLREEGEQPQLVIGMLESAPSTETHAWVELDGSDVGPPPGAGSHREMARYGT